MQVDLHPQASPAGAKGLLWGSAGHAWDLLVLSGPSDPGLSLQDIVLWGNGHPRKWPSPVLESQRPIFAFCLCPK